ncbi:MAG: cyclase family protein [Saprospirales bacterium]|nr:cyclase family protein [Saprospirales bacterium]MBK8491523.1 cyclase family protein [Saprospirales bacterium]
MIVQVPYQDGLLQADLTQPVDISIPLREGHETVNCFYAPYLETAPVVAGSFIGSTAKGGPVNFLNVKLNPHGNGTHTECVGHIAREPFSINETLTKFHFLAKLLSVYPTRTDAGDRVIGKAQVEDWLEPDEVEAVVLRTLPNETDKLTRHYSGTNPPYLHHEAVDYLVERGVQHLLLDLPSVDREEDEGKLLAHRAFWKYPGTVEAGRRHCTITELIYVPDDVPDGLYLLQLQITSLEIDASPSKPVLYKLV